MEIVEHIVAIRNALRTSFARTRCPDDPAPAFKKCVDLAEETVCRAFGWTVTVLGLDDDCDDPADRALFVVMTKTVGLPEPITHVRADFEPCGEREEVHILGITCDFADGRRLTYELYTRGVDDVDTQLQRVYMNGLMCGHPSDIAGLPDRVNHDDAIMFMHDAITDRFETFSDIDIDVLQTP